MKAIVVYFSLEGHTQYVAEEITKNIEAELLAIQTVRPYPKGKLGRYFWCGKSVVFGEKPKLVPYQFDSSKYDVIIIGTPIWAGSYTSPLHTFLKENNLKASKVAVYACHSGGGAGKCFNKFEEEFDGIVTTLELINPRREEQEKNTAKIEAFCKIIQEVMEG